MPTQLQYDRIRRDLRIDEIGLPDEEIDDLYLQAADRSFASNSDAVETWVRIKAVRWMIVEAAKEVDYTQGQSSEKLSQRVQNLVKYVLPIYESDFASIAYAAFPNVMWGALRRPRTTLVEYPEDILDYNRADVSRMTGYT